MLRAYKTEDGSFLWEFEPEKNGTAGFPISDPTVANGRVFFGSHDKQVYAVSTAGVKLWNCTTEEVPTTSPTVAYGLVFIGSNDNVLHALDELNGTRIWSYKITTTTVASGTAMSKVAVKAGYNIQKSVFVASSAGDIIALNALTGTVIWTFATNASTTEQPTPVVMESTHTIAAGPTSSVLGGAVVFVSFHTYLYALDANSGKFLWKANTTGLIGSAPGVVGDKLVYAGSYDERVYWFEIGCNTAVPFRRRNT
jgi:outer membrane protein assembly factor BamB